MILRMLILWFTLILPAHADIYKSVDSDGHITYSSIPGKGAIRLNLSPPTAQKPRTMTSPGDFPKVDGATQRSRDDGRRRILEDELSNEVRLLEEARSKSVSADVPLHEKNIAALRAELARLK